MIKEEYKYSELTSKIIGYAMMVHTIIDNHLSFKSHKSNKS